MLETRSFVTDYIYNEDHNNEKKKKRNTLNIHQSLPINH